MWASEFPGRWTRPLDWQRARARPGSMENQLKQTCVGRSDVMFGSPMTPIVSRSLKLSTAPALVTMSSSRSSSAQAPEPEWPLGARHTLARTTAPASGATIRSRDRTSEIPGPACYCGRHGCLERWVAGWSFARDYHQHASIDMAPSEPLTPAEIVSRMREGDRLAKLVWSRCVDRVARGLSVVINTLDPDILVLGGGMANVDELYDDLPPRLADETFSPCFYTPIVRAAHGDSSGVRGAAWLWR
jgi:ROK family